MKLPSNWNLPEEIRLRFGQTTYGKQRAMVADGHLLLILHKLPKWGERERTAVLFWRDAEGKWEFSGRGVGLHALRKHVQEYEDAEEHLDNRYDTARNAADYFGLLESLAPVLHSSRNLHRTLQAAREAAPADRDLIDLRDAAAELERNFDLLHSSSKNALDFEIAKRGEEQAALGEHSIRVGNRLNVIAAIFFPLTAISGIFGMNLPHGITAASPMIFWLILVTGVVIGFLLKSWVLSGGPKKT